MSELQRCNGNHMLRPLSSRRYYVSWKPLLFSDDEDTRPGEPHDEMRRSKSLGSAVSSVKERVSSRLGVSPSELIKILVGFIQVVNTFDVTYSVVWPQELRNVWTLGGSASVFRLALHEVVGFHCVSDALGFFPALQIVTITPLVVSFLFSWPSLILLAFGLRNSKRFQRVIRKFYFGLLAWQFFIFPGVSFFSIRGLHCLAVGDKRFLYSDVEVPCPVDDPSKLEFWWTLGSISLYVIGTPTFLYWTIVRFKIPQLAKSKTECAYIQKLLSLHIGIRVKEVAALRASATSTTWSPYLVESLVISEGANVQAKSFGSNFSVPQPPSSSSTGPQSPLAPESLNLEECQSPTPLLFPPKDLSPAQHGLIGDEITMAPQSPKQPAIAHFADRGDEVGFEKEMKKLVNLAAEVSKIRKLHDIRDSHLDLLCDFNWEKVRDFELKWLNAVPAPMQSMGDDASEPVSRAASGPARRSASGPATRAGSEATTRAASASTVASDGKFDRRATALVFLSESFTADRQDRQQRIDWLVKLAKKMADHHLIPRPHLVWNAKNSETERVAIQKVGFFIESYRVDMYYWEMLELLRKFLMVGLMVFLWPGTLAQIMCGFAVCAVYFFIYFWCQPFASNLTGRLMKLSLATQSVALFYGLMSESFRITGSWSNGSVSDIIVRVIMMGLNLLTFTLPLLTLVGPSIFKFILRRFCCRKDLAADELSETVPTEFQTRSLALLTPSRNEEEFDQDQEEATVLKAPGSAMLNGTVERVRGIDAITELEVNANQVEIGHETKVRPIEAEEAESDMPKSNQEDEASSQIQKELEESGDKGGEEGDIEKMIDRLGVPVDPTTDGDPESREASKEPIQMGSNLEDLWF